MATTGNNDSEIPTKSEISVQENWQPFATSPGAANQPPDLLQNSKDIWSLLAATKAAEKVGKNRQKYFGLLLRGTAKKYKYNIKSKTPTKDV